jgi:hypothetical protein
MDEPRLLVTKRDDAWHIDRGATHIGTYRNKLAALSAAMALANADDAQGGAAKVFAQEDSREAPVEWALVPRQTVVPGGFARQAVTGHNVRYVLYFGLAGVIIGFIGISLFFAGQ